MELTINLGVFFLPFMSTFMVGTANSYNLTDGIDSLLASVSGIIAIGLLIFSFQKERYMISFFLICFLFQLHHFIF